MLRIRHKLGRADGAEIAEAALVLPLVFMFLLGIVWFGRAFNIYSTITQAAQQGAATAARPTCATCPQACAWGTTSFACDATVESSVFSVMDASSLDRTQIMTYAPSGLQPCPDPAPAMDCPHTTANNISICRSVLLNPSTAEPPPPAQCGTVVSFQYPFQFNLPFTSLNMQPIVLKAQAQSRMEN